MDTTASLPTLSAATITRVNRQTGTQVSVGRPDGQWYTHCVDHAQGCTCDTKAARDSIARTPAEFCTECAELIRGNEPAARKPKAPAKPRVAAVQFTHEQLVEAYTRIFEDFALSTDDVASYMGMDRATATKLLRKLERSYGVCSDHINGEKELTWQCYETYDQNTLEGSLVLAGLA